jgi:hypothetical protein
MQMFGEDSGGVLHRHFIARESNEPRATFEMEFMERRAQQWRLLTRFAHARLRALADRAS